MLRMNWALAAGVVVTAPLLAPAPAAPSPRTRRPRRTPRPPHPSSSIATGGAPSPGTPIKLMTFAGETGTVAFPEIRQLARVAPPLIYIPAPD
jgi:hypothetical protein